ncbi:uncharacterized protein LOC117722744 isoform X2 [Arvicanthis niloticus]|uniref:uncharacterized protein LOC117722744 isoform X2 n=1 Tax=Arvicanthis niloticus TaxID=61156 RepID=UPI00402B6FA3
MSLPSSAVPAGLSVVAPEPCPGQLSSLQSIPPFLLPIPAQEEDWLMAWEAAYLLSAILLLLLASVPSVSTGAEKLRFSIQHSYWFNFFTVIMTELKMSDSGIYHCGIAGNSREVTILRSIHLVVSKASTPHTTTRMTTALASTHSPVTGSSQDTWMWKVIVAGVVVAILLLLGLAILVVFYLRNARGKAQNVENKCHPIYEDFSEQREETTSFNQQVPSSEDTGTVCYASLIHLNHVSPQDSIYSNTQPYQKPSPDPLLSVEYASISRNRLRSSNSDAQEAETRD